MAFFKNIKRSFGFADSEEEYDYEDGIDATVKRRESVKPSNISDEPVVNYANRAPYHASNTSYVDESAEDKLKKMQMKIFEGVVDLFNKSLPDFISSCVDKEAQKQYIFDSLDKSLRNYIVNIRTEARQVCEAQWEKERSKIMSEMIEIKSKYREIESTKDDWKRQQLSAERQKRALSARLHDLEVQVASLEAEKEQFSLENKSLINKLKVSNMNDGAVESLQEEIDRLQLALKEARSGSSSFDYDLDTVIAEKDDIINQLQQQINSMQNESSNNTDIDGYIAKIEALTEENTKLTNSLEQIKIKEEIADAMINDLKEKASTSMRQLEASQKEKDEIEERANNYSIEIEDLKREVEKIKAAYSEKVDELNSANEDLKMIENIQSEMDKFEKIKKKKDLKISELQKEISLYKSKVSSLERDVDSLKSTIENNLYNQAISENRLKKEIENLKSKSDDKVEEITEVKISAIDESLDDADWLISIPPEGTQMRPNSSSSDDDFGYQEPTKKSTPNNEAQMSLW